MSNVVLSEAIDIESDGFARIHEENVLAPGYYWRAKVAITEQDTTWNRTTTIIEQGEVLLLLDVHEFEGSPHSVELLQPPSRGGHRTYKLLVQDFFENMEPCHEAQTLREQEQADILAQVRAIQEEMAQADANPLALPGIQEAAEKAVTAFERQEELAANQTKKTESEREKDLRRIHRRAARRSESAGNPLVVQNVVISNQLSDMIDGGVTSEGLKELTIESRRRTAIATATANWISKRAEDIGRTMAQLTPYYAERAKVALARSKKAIRYAEEISKGLKSLELYTGDGIDVVEVRTGASACTAEPLTLVQGKRFMAEEVAVFADIDENFDFADQSIFFDLLAKHDVLRDQVFPTPRCVVSMAVNRHRVTYGEKVSMFEAAQRDAKNRLVFLLVRDGDNIHVVYSSEPSHEAAHQLFPCDDDLTRHFTGIDGTRIKLKDVAFVEASRKFDDQALHYKRFLILLCGLDHRLHLMGEFYPPQSGLQFMSLDFQSKYFRFLEDDRPERTIGQQLEPVSEWMVRCNTSLRSGSRVMIASTARANSPALTRYSNHSIARADLDTVHVVAREGQHHYVTVRTTNAYSFGPESKTVKVWLDGPNATHSGRHPCFLCLDLVRPQVIHQYIHSRTHRADSISWIRIFKRIHAVLSAEYVSQAPLREHLRYSALQHGGIAQDRIDEAVDVAIMTWRASHRGCSAPEVNNTKAVNEILTLLYPSERIAASIEPLLERFIADHGLTPLKLVRTGKTRLALYVVANEADKEPYAPGCRWGWAKKMILIAGKTKLSVASTSLVWIEKGYIDPSEELIREWPGLVEWTNEKAEPVRLRHLERIKTAMQEAEGLFTELLHSNRFERSGLPMNPDLFADLQERSTAYYRSANSNSKDIRIAIPVGVYQTKQDGPVKFLYMQTRVTDFVRQYGDDAQFMALVSIAKRYGFGRRTQAQEQGACHWRLTEMQEPFTQWVNGSDCERPDFLSARIQKNSPRPFFQKGTKGDGKPRLSDHTASLSFNRAVDALMQKAPHLKRNFYKNLRNEIQRLKRFPDFNGDRKQRLKELQSQRYAINTNARYLSSMIWSQSRNRSLACKLFGAAS